jgi:hypothetical protein
VSALDPRYGSGDKFDASNSDITEVPDWFQRYLRAALASPLFSVPKPFETWMIDRVATSGFDLPISQIVGFSQFTAQAAPTIGTSESTTSTTFTDLATVGPSLTGLPDGEYVFFFGAEADTATAGKIAAMALSINAAALGTPPIGDDCESRSDQLVSISRAVTATLSNGGNNSVVAKYATDDALAAAFFSSRWLIALRYANA